MRSLNTNDCPIYALLMNAPEGVVSSCRQCGAHGDEEYCCTMQLLKFLCERDDAQKILNDCRDLFERMK